MSLSNYSEFSTGLLKWLNREGFTSLSDMIPDLIAIAQRRIMREADLAAMETVTSLAISGSSASLPADFMRMKSISIVSGSWAQEIEGAPAQSVFNYTTTGVPSQYAVVGTTIHFSPPPNDGYTANLVYYAKLPILSDAQTTNWFTDNEPEFLLYACMVEACMFLKDDARTQAWEARYQSLKESLLASESRMDKESGGLRVRAR